MLFTETKYMPHKEKTNFSSWLTRENDERVHQMLLPRRRIKELANHVGRAWSQLRTSITSFTNSIHMFYSHYANYYFQTKEHYTACPSRDGPTKLDHFDELLNELSDKCERVNMVRSTTTNQVPLIDVLTESTVHTSVC